MSEQKSSGKTTDVKDDAQPVANALNPTLNEKIPSSNVNLRFLFINGRKFDLLVSPTDTIETIRKAALQAWPKEYVDEIPSNHSSIKFLFRGRYLENGTITHAGIPTGETTIVHLLVKRAINGKAGEKSESKSSKCCIIS